MQRVLKMPLSLIKAIKSNNKDKLKAELDKKAYKQQPELLNSIYPSRWIDEYYTPLLFAANQGYLDAVEVLFERQAVNIHASYSSHGGKVNHDLISCLVNLLSTYQYRKTEKDAVIQILTKVLNDKRFNPGMTQCDHTIDVKQLFDHQLHDLIPRLLQPSNCALLYNVNGRMHFLFQAARRNVITIVDQALDNMKITNVDLIECLTGAVLAGNIEIISKVLARFPKVTGLNSVMRTLLFDSSAANQVEMVTLLANTENFNWNSVKTLEDAMLKKDLEDIVLLAIAHPKFDPTLVDDNGDTLLALAAKHGKVNIVAALLAKDNINIQTQNKQGHSPVILAFLSGKADTGNMLLKSPHFDPTHIYAGGQNLAMHAAVFQQDSLLNYVLNLGAVSIDAQDDNKETALTLAAASSDNAHVVRVLMDHNADPRLVNKRGYDAQMEANDHRHAGLNTLIDRYMKEYKPSSPSVTIAGTWKKTPTVSKEAMADLKKRLN